MTTTAAASRPAPGNGKQPARALHTFVAYVEDKPGVLARVASLFRRRAYNIDSLTVGRTDVPGVSRMTIVMEADATTARLVEANLYKLVNVLRVEDVTYEPTVTRDLALIKVRADASSRAQVLQIVEVFRARVVDVAPEALIVEITGTEDKLQGLVDVLRPFGIIEMVRTGSVAMTRGADAIPVDPTFVHARVPTNGNGE
ncbi:MAG: acetolactate synthase small subunit [Deltaproteobacteria bacterium]|nr:MAG: acetolactate synthase small subunit [Deltaproteobacteria bacterium]